SLYSDVVTSGEHVHHCLKTRPDAFYQGLGKRFFIFPWDGDRQIIDGLGFIEVNRMEDADFVLCAGVERGGLAAYLDDLDRALSCNLPMIVANPDLVSKKPDGTLQLCPGSIANHYETMGGQVRWHGKPDPAIYQFCASGIQPDKTLAIGDSLTHDIRGGQNAGYRTLFIEDGIHHLELAEHGLAQLCQRHSVQPDYCSSILKW
ncbi:MAG: HAD-IA family hydrolase, partial [Pseudomonadota bacterium]